MTPSALLDMQRFTVLIDLEYNYSSRSYRNKGVHIEAGSREQRLGTANVRTTFQRIWKANTILDNSYYFMSYLLIPPEMIVLFNLPQTR